MSSEPNYEDNSVYIEEPKPVGWWIIGKGYARMYNAVYQKPNRFHRFMTTLLLGWEWKDNNQ